MISPEAAVLGARLDQDHWPETNGRMPVCRRCGAYTESPQGRQHVPSEHRLARAEEWLDAQGRTRRLAYIRASVRPVATGTSETSARRSA
jgi:hypothetical protein